MKLTKSQEAEVLKALTTFAKNDGETDTAIDLFTPLMRDEITGKNYELGMPSESIVGFMAGYVSCMKKIK